MMRDTFLLELRVLDGRHAGASAPVVDGLLIGSDEKADLILTDLAAEAGLARLHLLEGGRWLLWPFDQTPDEQARADAPLLGVARPWGQRSLCVSAPHTDWPGERQPSGGSIAPPQTLPNRPSLPEHAPEVVLASTEPTPPQQEVLHDPVVLPVSPLPAASQVKARRRHRWPALVGWVLLPVLIAAVFFVWRSTRPVAASASAPAMPPDLTAQAQGQLPGLQLDIARIDPALRLQLTPRPDGRVLVQGWVDSLAQLDRLAEALARQQPQPVMQVRVASEMRGELGALLAASFPQLSFVPNGPTSVRVEGIVQNEAVRAEALAAVRAVLPRELALVDGMRLARTMAPELQSALAAAGFAGVRAHWEGEEMQVALALEPNARGRLENALVALVKRFRGLPLHVVAEPVQELRQADRGPAPFAIRGVVGGAVPYLVLPDGSRIQPGGTHGGWRLQSIAPDVLVFDAPRRLVVDR